MLRSTLAGTVVLLLLLAGTMTAQAANLAGKWTATYQKQSLVLQLKGSGDSYTGTYTFITKIGAKSKQSVSPVKASVKVVKNITNVTLTFTNTETKTHFTSNCALIKGTLRCIAQTSQKVIVFTHTHS